MKRVLLILIILALFIFHFSIYLQASSSVDIIVKVSPNRAKAGDIINLKISMRNYQNSSVPDIGGLQIDIPINPVFFEYVAKSEKVLLPIEPGDITSISFNGRKDQFSVIYVFMNADSKPLSRDTVDIASFRLKVRQQIPLDKVIKISGKAMIATTASPAREIPNQVIPAELRSGGITPTTKVIIPTTVQSHRDKATSPVVTSEEEASPTLITNLQPDGETEISASNVKSTNEDIFYPEAISTNSDINDPDISSLYPIKHSSQSTVGLGQLDKDQNQTIMTEKSDEPELSRDEEETNDYNSTWLLLFVLSFSSLLLMLLYIYRRKKQR